MKICKAPWLGLRIGYYIVQFYCYYIVFFKTKIKFGQKSSLLPVKLYCDSNIFSMKVAVNKVQNCSVLNSALYGYFSYDQAFIRSQIAGVGGHVWTDLNDRDNPGSYVWTNGGSPSFTAWASGQPSRQNYVLLYFLCS